ncbi:MAG: hypothetical protein JWN39_2521 [Ilumatobacteraceae bacterium]|nr:hypothetical protein [Ilumatobacteraceae bacterium]
MSASIRAAMAIMAAQHGVASDRQVRSCDVSADVQRRLVERGLLVRFAPSVVGDAGTETTWHRRAMAATLAPGAHAVLAGATAARLHRLDGFDDVERIIVVVDHGGRKRVGPGVTVVQARYLTAADRTVGDGIPTLTVAATLVSLARVRHAARSQALDAALRDGAKPIELRAEFARHRRHGARGPTEMISMLDQRVNARLPRSWFQRVAGELLLRYGIETVDEWVVADEHGNVLAELDLARVDLQVALECQSWEWHGTPSARRKDATRKRRLRRLGWEIIELWWSDLDHLEEVVTDFLDAVDRARRIRATP